MTTADTKFRTDRNGDGVAVMPRSEEYFVFPDPPEDPYDKMTNFDHLTFTGNVLHLAMHLGDLDTTLIAGERYLSLAVTRDMKGVRYPDMIVAFDVRPAEYKARNAYVISDQGKPPDFVLEIASHTTGHIDVGAKRDDYASLGIPEYWRFDETGEHHGARLAGDRLVDGGYEPIEIVEVEDGVLEGYSAVLNLHLRWQHGELKWHDPDTGEHIPTFESEREGRLREQARADALEAELRQLRGH